MALLSTIAAGSRITAAMLRAIAPLAAYKNADQSVTNSTVLVNDTQLFLPLLANSTYVVVCHYVYEGFTAGSSDISLKLALPASATMRMAAIYYSSLATPALSFFPQTETAPALGAATGGAGAIRSVILLGTISTAGTPGNAQTQFAQHTATASLATTMHAGSVMAGWQIG